MNNLEKAKDLLKSDNYTLILCKDDITYTSDKKGVAPMLEFIGNNTDLNSFSAADKIIGKAAAMLFSLAGVREVYAKVMSQSAVDFFDDNEIEYSYDVLTEKIINRKGDGVCPMEETVANISDTSKAYEAIKNKLLMLQKGARK